MRISEYYKLELEQPSLDFVDVELDSDSCLFIDPAALNNDNTEWGRHCKSLIKDYFSLVLRTIRKGDDKQAIALLKELSEPNETRLGFSRNRVSGRGVGSKVAKKIWNALKNSDAVSNGLIEDIEDTVLLIDGISSDIISDIVTNIIRGPLIEYTQLQCRQLNIDLEYRKSKKIWDINKQIWETKNLAQPVVMAGGRESVLTLVPKSIVRKEATYDAGEYFNEYIVTRLQQEDVADGLTRILKTTREEKPPFKKDVLERRGINSRSNIKQHNSAYTAKYPELLKQYKSEKDSSPAPALTHQDFANNINTPPVNYDYLLSRVLDVKPGRDSANYYEKAIMALLNAVFYPYLSNPNIHARLNNGAKIVDIVYSNTDKEDFFWWLGQHYRAPYIFVECKNYAEDVGNPEIDQLIGRFGPDKGTFGLSISRHISDRKRVNNYCINAMIDKQGYILALDDSDLGELVDAAKNASPSKRLQLLRDRFEKLVFRNS